MDWLADLTPVQQEAVSHLEGPLLILAGAGSGKTRVITYRIAYLLEQGVKPYNILAITFTNKAAGEMRQRVDKLVPNNRFWISTFHSFGARLLRQYADRVDLDRNFTVYDQADRTRLVKDALAAANIDNIRYPPERIESAISKAKNYLLTPDRYAAHAGDFFTQTVATVYPIYQKKLRAANAVDFDDLLLLPALALKNDEELRAELDARFRFVQIDEYQDTNQAQYAIARQLSRDQRNLCVVGDPDQSIYKWRGSDIRNILDFERDFPDAKVIILERNYRSTKSILQAASQLIGYNEQRKRKRLVTENPQGQPVQVLTFATGLAEADGIARRVREAVDAGQRSYRDFAVFLRVNALTRNLEAAFVQQRVPFQIVRGLAFFERKENRDVLAYLRLLLNPRDDLSFLRAVNEPTRGIGKVSLEHLQEYAEAREISLLAAGEQVAQIPAIKGKAATALADFAKLIRELAELVNEPADEIIRRVLDCSGYRRMLQSSTDSQDQERLANIEELITAAKQFISEDSSRTLSDFLESVTLSSDQDGWDEKQDCVSIMTLHAAKGLEFPVVYMVAVEEGLLPHERSLEKKEDVEEERRLAFVGMTRAKEELYLCHARQRDFRGTTIYAVPSVFLSEVSAAGVEFVDLSGQVTSPVTKVMHDWRSGGAAAEAGWAEAGIRSRVPASPLPASNGTDSRGYAVGALVKHENYGIGKVMDVSGYGSNRRLKVRFAAHGDKTFVAEKAKLAVVHAK
jgi:DNA helicase-2/ATP-dependent DNA helicase PcrA